MADNNRVEVADNDRVEVVDNSGVDIVDNGGVDMVDNCGLMWQMMMGLMQWVSGARVQPTAVVLSWHSVVEPRWISLDCFFIRLRMGEPGDPIRPALRCISWVSLCQGLPLVALTPLVPFNTTWFERKAASGWCDHEKMMWELKFTIDSISGWWLIIWHFPTSHNKKLWHVCSKPRTVGQVLY